MKSFHSFLTLFCAFLVPLMVNAGGNHLVANFSIVPQPVSIKMKTGAFTITDQTRLLVAGRDIDLKNVAILFAEQLRLAGGPFLRVQQMTEETNDGGAIVFTYARNRENLETEGYRLNITPNGILLTGNSGAGLFYGMQTLLQLLPPEVYKLTRPQEGKSWIVPCTEINDAPRFAYRGMHLDVSRHFFPKEFIFKYIDLLAMYKMNIFHWHLTDDNGWRIEIRKYPKLTEVGAWRVDRENLPWRERPQQQAGEQATYGGFYTQDDIREIVQYAAQRYITIIPEIEMPAHSVEVLSAYPNLSCTGGPFTVPPGSYWPNSDIFCAGNDSVFTFLEDVLTEVMDLFPSEYIHVGGDEATKTRWEECLKCRQRMKEEGLKNVQELQSYFIKRMEKFINSKGKKLIGWDEILEGGLAPEATVMSWRGLEGGIAAARQGHDVIMTPTSHCYFDYYQADPEFEPEAIGGLTTLKKVYSFEPVPEELTTEEGKHILGAQGNVWTEFIPTPSQAEYMAVPRMIALAEVDWSPAKLRNWEDFRQRLESQFKRLEYMGVNFSKGSYHVDIQTRYDAKNSKINVSLSSEQPGIPIRYTTNGNDPTQASTLYTEPFEISANAYIKAGLFVDGKLKEKASEMPIIFHHAIGKSVNYLHAYSNRYPASGNSTLTDGIRGTTNHRDGRWQGFLGSDVEVIIDLGKEIPVQSVSTTFLNNSRSWIFAPSMVEFSLSSNGKKWHSVYEKRNPLPEKAEGALIQPFSTAYPPGTTARYVKVKACSQGNCPGWHEGKGEKCWIFFDEIVVF
ncbi:MAG: family 20 glycosylhydrolase [Bacteroidales bacterium]|nr:family 20 glycosylhydrolase [Bacteroidales bacterium]